MIRWKQQLERDVQLKNIDTWPAIPIDHLSNDDYRIYLRNLHIMIDVLASVRIKTIMKNHSISKSFIYYLLNRCLSSKENAEPALRRGLIPKIRLKKNQRKSPVPNNHNRMGPACAFKYLLEEVDGLKDHLTRHVVADLNNKNYGQNLTAKLFHSCFIDYLTKIGYSKDYYPFTEPLRGYESVRVYFNQIRLDLKSIYSKVRITQPKTNHLMPFQELQFDEQTYDAEVSIGIKTGENITFIRVARASYLNIIDVATNYSLAHSLILSRKVDQDDILMLLLKIRDTALPPLHSELFQYPPAIANVKAIEQQIKMCQIGNLVIDNDMTHLAKSIKQFARNEHIGLNYGLIKSPKRRNTIEYCFHRLNALSHRLKSTTGSHVRDPIKETARNRKNPPKVLLNDLEDMLNIENAKHNVLAQAVLSSRSPLERLTELLTNQYWFISGNTSENTTQRYRRQIEVTLHCGKTEVRMPYVYFYYVRYTLESQLSSIEKREMVVVDFDIRDIRRVKIIRKNGEYLGSALAAKSWQTHAHGIRTRKRINKLTKEKRIQMLDPLVNYFEYLLTHKSSPTIGLELIRVERERRPNQALMDEGRPKESAQLENVKSPPKILGKRKRRSWHFSYE
jgi:putative transposase